MCPPPHPPAMSRRNGCSPAKKLDKKPKTQHNNCGQFDHLPDNKQRNKNEHTCPWEGNHVSAEYTRNRTACSHTGNSRLTVEINMYHGRPDPADEIKEDEFETSQLILNIIPENPQIPHISYEMDEPSVEKHKTEKRKIGIYKSGTRDI